MTSTNYARDIEKELKHWMKVRDGRKLSRDAAQPSLFSMGAVVRQRAADTNDDAVGVISAHSRRKRRKADTVGNIEHDTGAVAGLAAAEPTDGSVGVDEAAQLRLNRTPTRQPAQRLGTVRCTRPAVAAPAQAAWSDIARADRPALAQLQAEMFRFIIVRGTS